MKIRYSNGDTDDVAGNTISGNGWGMTLLDIVDDNGNLVAIINVTNIASLIPDTETSS